MIYKPGLIESSVRLIVASWRERESDFAISLGLWVAMLLIAMVAIFGFCLVVFGLVLYDALKDIP